MQIIVIESDPQKKATLLARAVDGLRQADIRGLEVIELKRDAIGSHVWGTVCGVLLGPSCHEVLQDIVEQIRSNFSSGPISIVLSPEVYENESVAVTKKYGIRTFSFSDLNQIASFLIESENHIALSSGTKNRNVIGVCQFKGGVGTTTLAVALAACWARHEIKTALIDLDDVNPQITSWARVGTSRRGATAEHLELGQVPEASITDIASPVETFNGYLSVIGQPEDYNTAFHFKANVLDTAPSASEFIQSLISALKSSFEIIVIDLARSWGLATFASLPRCQRVLLVTDEDRLSIKRTLDCLKRLKRESDDSDEFDLSKWSVVCNAHTGALTTEEDLKKLLLESDLFSTQLKVSTIPYSPKGRAWGEPGQSFYDLAENSTQEKIKALAYDLIPFRTKGRERRKSEALTGIISRVLGR